MRIVVRQNGGLGNQLFQYAAGRLLAKKFDAPLRIATEFPSWQASHGHPRPFMLSRFAIDARFGQKNYLDRIVFGDRAELATASRMIRVALNIQVIQETDFWFYRDFEVDANARSTYLLGSWQNYRMAQQVESELRQELQVREPLAERNLEMATRISDSENSVSIHLRRGDYGSAFGSEAILPMSYYERSIELLQSRFERPSFFVFSDDVKFARDWAAGKPRFIVVDHNDSANAHEDLRLMALCQHQIIANSSFSWWGAWLNANAAKQVIAPSKWLGFESRQSHLLPPEWTVIETAYGAPSSTQRWPHSPGPAENMAHVVGHA